MYHSLMPTGLPLHAGETCTVVTSAVHGRCGAPAVFAFLGRGETRYAECAEHVPATPEACPVIRAGALVCVRAYGLVYEGVVTHVMRTRCDVKFVTRGGKTKVITVPISEVLV